MPMFALNFVNLFDCKTFNCTHVSKKARINKKINKYINNNFEVVKNDFEVEHSHTGSSSAIHGRIGLWQRWLFMRAENWSTRKKISRNKGENRHNP